jgi:hypothetical protein
MHVLDFLVRLGEDPALRTRFVGDGVRVMTEAGLAANDCDALMSGDDTRVRASAGVECASLPPKIVTAPASRWLRAA